MRAGRNHRAIARARTAQPRKERERIAQHRHTREIGKIGLVEIAGADQLDQRVEPGVIVGAGDLRRHYPGPGTARGGKAIGVGRREPLEQAKPQKRHRRQRRWRQRRLERGRRFIGKIAGGVQPLGNPGAHFGQRRRDRVHRHCRDHRHRVLIQPGRRAAVACVIEQDKRFGQSHRYGPNARAGARLASPALCGAPCPLPGAACRPIAWRR